MKKLKNLKNNLSLQCTLKKKNVVNNTRAPYLKNIYIYIFFFFKKRWKKLISLKAVNVFVLVGDLRSTVEIKAQTKSLHGKKAQIKS